MSQLGDFEILLVDDNQSDAQIFEAALQEASARARVYWVATGQEALDFLRRRTRFEDVGSVRIVVLDLHLAAEDGVEVLREIKTDPDLNRTPVIMLTSSMSQDEIDLAYSLGANAYFRKPITLQSYVEILRTLAQHWLDLAHLPSAARRPNEPASPESSNKLRHRADQDS
jgi:chemotaxis family two-component system response regulator Rcp1